MSLSKTTPKLRTLSDGDISLSSNFWKVVREFTTLLFCAQHFFFVPIIINYVLSEFSLSLLDFMETERRQENALSIGV